MPQQITKAFLDYRNTLLLAGEVAKFRKDRLAGKAVEIIQNHVVKKKRVKFIAAIQKICSNGHWFIVELKDRKKVSRLQTLVLFDDFINLGHFIFYLSPRINAVETSGSVIKIKNTDLDVWPFLKISNIYCKINVLNQNQPPN
jgi:hypothetical protein